MLLATLVALLVAAVGTFSVLGAGSRQRATEMMALEVAGVRHAVSLARYRDLVCVDSALGSVGLRPLPRFPEPAETVESGSLLAPMPAAVARVDVAEGAEVEAGQSLLVLEATGVELDWAPVVLVSARESEADAERASAAGADMLLSKRECVSGRLEFACISDKSVRHSHPHTQLGVDARCDGALHVTA